MKNVDHKFNKLLYTRIFNNSKLWVVIAKHNFELLKIRLFNMLYYFIVLLIQRDNELTLMPHEARTRSVFWQACWTVPFPAVHSTARTRASVRSPARRSPWASSTPVSTFNTSRGLSISAVISAGNIINFRQAFDPVMNMMKKLAISQYFDSIISTWTDSLKPQIIRGDFIKLVYP